MLFDRTFVYFKKNLIVYFSKRKDPIGKMVFHVVFLSFLKWNKKGKFEWSTLERLLKDLIANFDMVRESLKLIFSKDIKKCCLDYAMEKQVKNKYQTWMAILCLVYLKKLLGVISSFLIKENCFWDFLLIKKNQ